MKSTTATNPFVRSESSIFKAFELAKKGTSREALKSFCDRNKIGTGRVLREITSGQFKNYRWKVDRKESGDTVKIKVHSIVELKTAAKAKAPAKGVKATTKKAASKKKGTVKSRVAAKAASRATAKAASRVAAKAA